MDVCGCASRRRKASRACFAGASSVVEAVVATSSIMDSKGFISGGTTPEAEWWSSFVATKEVYVAKSVRMSTCDMSGGDNY